MFLVELQRWMLEIRMVQYMSKHEVNDSSHLQQVNRTCNCVLLCCIAVHVPLCCHMIKSVLLKVEVHLYVTTYLCPSLNICCFRFRFPQVLSWHCVGHRKRRNLTSEYEVQNPKECLLALSCQPSFQICWP